MTKIITGVFKGCRCQRLKGHEKRIGKDVPAIGVRIMELPDKGAPSYKIGDVLYFCEYQLEDEPACKPPMVILDRNERLHFTCENQPKVIPRINGFPLFDSEELALEFLRDNKVFTGFIFEYAFSKKGKHAVKVATLKQKWKAKLSKNATDRCHVCTKQLLDGLCVDQNHPRHGHANVSTI